MGIFNSYNNKLKNEKITKEYFSNIKTILKKKNISNFSLIDNLKICLNEKNFDQISNDPIQYFIYSNNEEPKFINWLEFIYQYLYKEKSYEKYWANTMIEKLDTEDFISESKYLSEFFLEEFEIDNEPKCIQLEKIKSKIKLNLNSSTLNVTQNLGGSFNNNNSFLNNEEVDIATVKYNEYRGKVKQYILKFKQHVLNEDHPINRVVQIFEQIWVQFANTQLNLLKLNYSDYNDKNNIKIINNQVNSLTCQLQRFVVHLQISLKLFYSRTIDYSCFTEEKDELINIITTLVFKTGKIYDTIFELYKLSLGPEISNITNCLKKLVKVSPEELGISKQFCLNKITLDYQEEILLNKLKNSKKNNNNNEKKKPDRKESLSSINKNINFKKRNKEIEEKNINLILKLVRENKKRCPKYGDREIEETKVNLNYEENYNLLISKEENEKKNLSQALLPFHELDNDIIDNNEDNYSVKKTNSKKENSINEKENNSDDNINNTNYSNNEDNYLNKNMIVRTIMMGEKEKNMIPNKLEKVFNRVAFIRTKNIEYLSYPYETAIQLLKQIQKYKTPFEKMMIIASISSEITDCINDFWTNLSDYIKKDFLNLEIDQLMTIFIYIIIKSQIYDISVHCKIIQSFTTCITKASMIGYYYSTVEASVSYIQSINNIKELIKYKI